MFMKKISPAIDLVYLLVPTLAVAKGWISPMTYALIVGPAFTARFARKGEGSGVLAVLIGVGMLFSDKVKS